MPIKNLLLVDDSEAEQFLYKAIISQYDSTINVLSACDGVEALEILERTTDAPDCILLDINMPRMNGFEFLDAYISKHQDKRTIIAVLTSSARASDKDKALSYPCVSEFYTKPINVDQIEKLAKLT